MIGRPTVSILQPGLGATGLHQSKVTGPSAKANRMLEPSERRATNQSAGTEARERLANRRASGERRRGRSLRARCSAPRDCAAGAGTEPGTWWKLVGPGARVGRAGRVGRRLGEVREESRARDAVAMATQVHSPGTRVPPCSWTVLGLELRGP